jgi:hypothetical protein
MPPFFIKASQAQAYNESGWFQRFSNTIDDEGTKKWQLLQAW